DGLMARAEVCDRPPTHITASRAQRIAIRNLRLIVLPPLKCVRLFPSRYLPAPRSWPPDLCLRAFVHEKHHVLKRRAQLGMADDEVNRGRFAFGCAHPLPF